MSALFFPPYFLDFIGFDLLTLSAASAAVKIVICFAIFAWYLISVIAIGRFCSATSKNAN